MKFAIINCLYNYGDDVIMDGRVTYPPNTKIVEANSPREAVRKGLPGYINTDTPNTTFVEGRVWSWGVYSRKEASLAKKAKRGWAYLDVMVIALD